MTDAAPQRPIFVVAPDKFKGTLTAPEAAAAIAAGIRAVVPDAEIRLLPMADGGEGTVDAAVAAGAERRTARVTGPLGDPIDAAWALLDGTAIIESAQAHGLSLVEPTPDTALDAVTDGVGELIRAALDAGAERIVVGLGGSASTDGGVGALRALGARTLAADGSDVVGGGRTLSDIARIELDGLDPRLATRRVLLASDVANPMSGPLGAARVFAPQKGADAAAVEALDAGLATFAAALRTATGVDLDRSGPDGTPWGGAAGGLAGGLRAALGGVPVNGTDELAGLLGVDAALEGASLLVVGEGSIDRQTALGKAPAALARRARDRGIRALAVAGRSELGPTDLAADGVGWIATASEWAGSDAAARADAARWVTHATRQALAGVAAPAPRPATVPTAPTPYFHFYRTPKNTWWRSLLLLVSLAAAFILSSTVFGLLAVIVDIASGRTRLEDYAGGSVPVTPMLFLGNNLSLAALIPISFLLQWAWTGQRPRWLSSVAGRFRWRWFGIVSAIAGPIWIGYLVLDTALNGGLGELRLSPDWLFMLVAVLVTTPFQSAGEEYAFRGAAVRAIAGWIPLPALAWAVGSVVPTAIFMSLHFASDPWLNLFYLAFGVTGSLLAWTTGGLEASIVVHVVNNTVLLLPVALWGDVGSVFSRGSGTGSPLVLIGMAAMALVIVVISLVAKRLGIARLGPTDALTPERG